MLGAALLRTPPPAGADPARGRDRLVLQLAVRNALALLTRGGRTRVLLVVDGLQWLDPATAAVLAFLARRPHAASPPALLGAVRLAPPYPAPRPAPRTRGCARVRYGRWPCPR